MARLILNITVLILSLLGLQGCATNPVTGKSQFMLISESQERQLGAEQYGPTIQSQGGQYYLDPDLQVYVRQVGEKLARVSDQPDLPYEFVVINSSIPNAWALPSGKIAINRGLLTEMEDEAQLAAVLSHEIVHAAARHSAQRLQQGLLLNAGLAGLGIMVSDNDFRDIILGGAAVGATLTIAKYGRGHELESDAYGMEYMARAGYDPQAAVELQEIFVKLAGDRESGWFDGLFASHPPSQERVARNRDKAQQLGTSARFRGKAEYARATAALRKRIPAYKAYDEGVKALSEGNIQAALGKTEEAIRLEPEEAMFYALRGDIHQKLGDEQKALADYNRAVELYPEHYAYLLKRGTARQQQGLNELALQDLQKSAELLPTSLAYYAMGEAALGLEAHQQALQYFQIASEGGGETGQMARDRAQTLARQLRRQ